LIRTRRASATERSVSLLLEQDFEVVCWRFLPSPWKGWRPAKPTPDLSSAKKGQRRVFEVAEDAPPYVDYLIARARQNGPTTGEGKKRAVEFLLPYVQKIPKAHCCARSGPPASRNSFAWMSRCCEPR